RGLVPGGRAWGAAGSVYAGAARARSMVPAGVVARQRRGSVPGRRPQRIGDRTLRYVLARTSHRRDHRVGAGRGRQQAIRPRNRRGTGTLGQRCAGDLVVSRCAVLTGNGRDAERTVWIPVVEDDAKLRALLARGLAEEGYAVDVAGDGAE